MTVKVKASDIAELRRQTGAGMLKCKKFLEEAKGDIEQAIVAMRKADPKAAAKREGKVTAEGCLAIVFKDDRSKAAMVEVNCETDFVGRSAELAEFAKRVALAALAANTQDTAAIMALADDSETLDTIRQALIARIGEKVELRRCAIVNSPAGYYKHGERIGVLISGDMDESIAKDIAMHVAACKPLVVQAQDMPAELLEKEREIYLAQAAESGKDETIMQKMVDGRVNKFIKENCLVGQPFVKSPDQKIADYLKQHNATVDAFVRYEVGEGIEKKAENFADEVRAQVEGAA